MPRSFSMSIIWKILAGLLASWAIVVLMEGPLVNLLCCMIFLLSVLDVIRISSLTVSFLRQLDSGIVCLGITSLWPMIWMGFKSRVKIHLFLWALSVHLFLYPSHIYLLFLWNSMTCSGSSTLHRVKPNLIQGLQVQNHCIALRLILSFIVLRLNNEDENLEFLGT